MTEREAEAVLSRLLVLRGMPDHAAPYAQVLAGLTPADVDRGVARALSTRTWFPSPAELLQDVLDARPRVTWQRDRSGGPVVVGDIRLPDGRSITVTGHSRGYDCEGCGDSGWAPVAARAVARCGCWATNPTLLRRRAAQAQQAASRTKGRGDE